MRLNALTLSQVNLYWFINYEYPPPKEKPPTPGPVTRPPTTLTSIPSSAAYTSVQTWDVISISNWMQRQRFNISSSNLDRALVRRKRNLIQPNQRDENAGSTRETRIRSMTSRFDCEWSSCIADNLNDIGNILRPGNLNNACQSLKGWSYVVLGIVDKVCTQICYSTPHETKMIMRYIKSSPVTSHNFMLNSGSLAKFQDACDLQCNSCTD